VPFDAVASRKTPMENVAQLNYKIVRTLSDGQQVLVGACEGVKEVRKIIEELSKYWTGHYTILYRLPGNQWSPNPKRNSP
jgi:hypothetical protein